MYLREQHNSGDRAQLRNNSFGVSATGCLWHGLCVVVVAAAAAAATCIAADIRLSRGFVRCANPDRTWQITYGLSWIFLFLPTEIRKETGNDGRRGRCT